MKYGYFHGDKGTYTGKSMELHGKIFHEILMIEGNNIGHRRLVTQLFD